MKTLPKFWAIRKDEENPLFEEAYQWFIHKLFTQKEIDNEDHWTQDLEYWGYDGNSKYNNGLQAYEDLEDVMKRASK